MSSSRLDSSVKKSAGIDVISVNLCIFNLSLKTNSVHGKLRIRRVIPLFKLKSQMSQIIGRHLICFDKLPERIMHYGLYQYVTQDKILYSKPFGFPKNNAPLTSQLLN